MSRAFTAPPPIKDADEDGMDEEQGGAGEPAGPGGVSPVKEVAAEGSRAERGSADGTPAGPRRQASVTPRRSKGAKEPSSLKHSRRASQQVGQVGVYLCKPNG